METAVGGRGRGFRRGRARYGGMCVTVLSMEQSDTTASSGFMIAEVQRRSGAYSDRHPDLLDSRLDRIREWLGRELRRERLGAEKSGVGAVSIRRREAVGLGQGDIRTKPISIVGTERQQTVHSRVSGALALCEIVRKTFRPGGFTAM